MYDWSTHLQHTIQEEIRVRRVKVTCTMVIYWAKKMADKTRGRGLTSTMDCHQQRDNYQALKTRQRLSQQTSDTAVASHNFGTALSRTENCLDEVVLFKAASPETLPNRQVWRIFLNVLARPREQAKAMLQPADAITTILLQLLPQIYRQLRHLCQIFSLT